MKFFKPYRYLLIGAALVTLLGATASQAASGTITFDPAQTAGLGKGRIVTTEWDHTLDSDPWNPNPLPNATYDVFAGDNSLLNVRIKAENFSSDSHLGVLFDSESSQFQSDLDLQRTDGTWDKGNLGNSELGHLLIIQEDGLDLRGPDGNGNNDDPNGWLDVNAANLSGDGSECSGQFGCTGKIDDEGSHPAGVFNLKFGENIRRLGIDLVDIEGPTEFQMPNGIPTTRAELMSLLDLEQGGYAAAGLNAAGDVVDFVSFSDLVDVTNARGYYDETIAFGNNSANRVKPITFSEGVMEVIISLGGSGAIDNIFFDTQVVPEPGTLILLGTGLLGLVAYKRRNNA
jgi:hypothetical protein